jgi:hypothetical protein
VRHDRAQRRAIADVQVPVVGAGEGEGVHAEFRVALRRVGGIINLEDRTLPFLPARRIVGLEEVSNRYHIESIP